MKNISSPTRRSLQRALFLLLLFVPLYYIIGEIRPERNQSSTKEVTEAKPHLEEHKEQENNFATKSLENKRENSLADSEVEIKRLELPQRMEGANNLFVVHKSGDRVNYSLEYDTERRHARWVAFTLDNDNSSSRVRRSDAWSWDPKLPKRYSTENWFRGSGYSRGHLVASEDRAYSQEANEQTFYYSNISPQLQEHNGGIWVKLERKIQAWGRDASLRDILYVTKGGTIREDQIETQRIRGKMVIPRYYWAALLLEKNGVYHSIAFLTEHRAYSKDEGKLRDLALSVDALEEFTGLDFFHNLPDDIERSVEAEDPNARLARTIWWS
ncbi:MAG: DNA/RNA non-specific endonuclease [Porphyromonadaceae bacterium]|nr:DNA/RNA non-specific endonuclease [Porphyromonadaceae bacterium]